MIKSIADAVSQFWQVADETEADANRARIRTFAETTELTLAGILPVLVRTPALHRSVESLRQAARRYGACHQGDDVGRMTHLRHVKGMMIHLSVALDAAALDPRVIHSAANANMAQVPNPLAGRDPARSS